MFLESFFDANFSGFNMCNRWLDSVVVKPAIPRTPDYEPDELPGCSTPRFKGNAGQRLEAAIPSHIVSDSETGIAAWKCKGEHSIWKNFHRVNRCLQGTTGVSKERFDYGRYFDICGNIERGLYFETTKSRTGNSLRRYAIGHGNRATIADHASSTLILS